MPKICRNGDIGTTGHGCDTMIDVEATQGSVFANGIPIARRGDPTYFLGITVFCVPHMAKVNGGSGTVFVKNVSVARIGDSYDRGRMIKGSGNVFAGGGGLGKGVSPTGSDIEGTPF